MREKTRGRKRCEDEMTDETDEKQEGERRKIMLLFLTFIHKTGKY